MLITFPVTVPKNFTESEVKSLLEKQGYMRIHARKGATLEVIQDRLRIGGAERARVLDAIEAALQGRARPGRCIWRRTSRRAKQARRPLLEEVRGDSRRDLHCADCDIHYQNPAPHVFSFNSPLGACEQCRGFGRTIGIDYGLVIPDESKTLKGGAIRPWQTESYEECQDDLLKFARKRGIPVEMPWRELTDEQRRWVIDGEGRWNKKVWYGAKRFFAWLESRSYKMHIRVLLSKYRAYTPCTECAGRGCARMRCCGASAPPQNADRSCARQPSAFGPRA